MKKLSTEEKAERYDKAYRIAEGIHKFSSNIAEIKRMEEIFPELAESDDERIKKRIILCLEEGVHNDIICDYEKNECIAWLEKQGEQKTIWHDKDEEPCEDKQVLICLSGNYYVDFYHKEDKRFYMFFRPKHYLHEIEKWAYVDDLLKLSKEQKSEEESWPNLSNCLHDCKKCTGKCFYRKEEYQGQKSPEWDKKDLSMLQLCIDVINAGANGKTVVADYTKITDWLKSLKLQNRWKPSDEQMEALHEAKDRNDKIGFMLGELYEQLKSLKGD